LKDQGFFIQHGQCNHSQEQIQHTYSKETPPLRRIFWVLRHFKNTHTSLIITAITVGLATISAATPNTPATLRAAITDLQSKYGKHYPQAEIFLNQLKQPGYQSGKKFLTLQREALAAHPLMANTPVLFVERAQYLPDHHNTETMFQTNEINTHKYRPGGALKTLNAVTGEIKTLLDPGPKGHLRDPEVHPNGKRILFSMRRNITDDYHIYEINSDGSQLRQLTSAPGVFDIDPCYLPDGGIIFTSSRDPKYCGCNRHIMGTLFKMESDGANIHQIGKSTLFEGQSSMMPDGRILYSRWEYVDRNFGDAQGLWTVNPDGTNHAVYWGNNTPSPGGVIDPRIIPGTGLCLSIFSSCHDVPWGAVAIIDRNRGVDGRQSVIRTWPANAIDLVGKGNWDAFKQVKLKYEDPWPLSETTFLVSRQIGKKQPRMGIFLIDTFGNEVLLHSEGRGCYDPMPLTTSHPQARKPLMRNYNNDPGTFYVQNVNIGTHMDGVQPGEVKFLRVIETPEKRNWTKLAWGGQGSQSPAMNWHNFESKRILGTVPVEKDGSAHFECPSDRFVYFQLLDQNKMMIHSMRSGTIIQSGETQGCVGCHETRTDSVPTQALQNKSMSMALRRAPSKLNGWHGNTRPFDYQHEIQPIFDQHCVSCHDFEKPAGNILNLAGDRSLVFNASYTDLWSRGYLKCVGGGPASVQQARSWGAGQSKLITTLKQNHSKIDAHKDLSLSAIELEKIITWIDLNAPYYPTFNSAYPDNPAGRSPLTPKEVAKLSKLTGTRFVMRHGKNKRTQISFERPELSRCLAKLKKDSSNYTQALAIIQTGQKRLIHTPRGDMKNFTPSQTDLNRLSKSMQRKKIENTNRQAIRDGNKVYDQD